MDVEKTYSEQKCEPLWAELSGIEYIYIPLYDEGPDDSGWSRISDVMMKGNALVHCDQGADRTGAIIGRFRLENQPLLSQEQVMEEAEAARDAVTRQLLADDRPPFAMPGSSLVLHKKFKTIHLVKEEGEVGSGWLNSAKVFCGRSVSQATHVRHECTEWPSVISPACTDCFNIARKRAE